MPFIESPNTFYIGRRYDRTTNKTTTDPMYYSSRDLLTHAVIVGMTGSGKTGLGLTLVEEAVMDNIPVIAIDPKGDLTNLLLTFPELRPADFAPWINSEDARRAGEEPAAYSGTVATEWKQGLADWDIVPGRMAAMQRAAQFSIYTPGSDSGLPLRVLDSLHAPKEGWAGNEEANRERINALATAILALIGKEADPVRDREHVLIANLIEYAWQNNKDLSIEDLIREVQNPPFKTLGVFDLEKFFPLKDRTKLAVQLNQIVATPSFQTWLRGDPLDIQKLLYQPNGRPRVSIIYIAHLTDAERLFVITLVLDALMAWMRTLPGTSSLRALLYFDELFGFFPPAPHNPPTKEPLLRLLKQARAFGVGIALATQNPIDLDYKGLSNAGTWFIGKLQTDNDKQRVLGGLQNIATAEAPINMGTLDRLLSSLGPRTFVMNNVHDSQTPSLFYTRWTMCYLRGPLTRPEIARIMAAQRADRAATISPTMPPNAVASPTANQVILSSTPLNTPAISPSSVPEAGSIPVLTQTSPHGITVPPPPSSVPEGAPGTPAGGTGFGASLLTGSAPAVADTTPPADASAAKPRKSSAKTTASAGSQPASVPANALATPPVLSTEPTHTPPGALIGIEQYFVAPTLASTDVIRAWATRNNTPIAAMSTAELMYRPSLLAQVAVRFLDRKTHIEEQQILAYQLHELPKAGLIPWGDSRIQPIPAALLASAPIGLTGAEWFMPLSVTMTDAKRLGTLSTELLDYTYRSATLVVYQSIEYKLISAPGESREAFLVRLQAAATPAGSAPLTPEQWAPISAAVQEITLTPGRKDIAMAQYGIVWLPAWYATVNGQQLAFSAFAP